jgi:pimeloyl-ACP methyl ester carboxylesterase
VSPGGGDDDPVPVLMLYREDAPPFAVRLRAGGAPTVVFCCGFNSEMAGIKARTADDWCAGRGLACLRFDWRGHGISEGTMEEATVGGWRQDARDAVDLLPDGPIVLVGSSMGAWIATLCALDRPGRVAGLVGIAAAPDFTERLVRPALTEGQRETLAAGRPLMLPTRYDGRPPVIGPDLLDEARAHLVLGRRLPIRAPVRLLHGAADADVPWDTSLRLLEAIDGPDVRLTLVKDGDHRLSRPEDLALLRRTLDEVAGRWA